MLSEPVEPCCAASIAEDWSVSAYDMYLHAWHKFEVGCLVTKLFMYIAQACDVLSHPNAYWLSAIADIHAGSVLAPLGMYHG